MQSNAPNESFNFNVFDQFFKKSKMYKFKSLMPRVRKIFRLRAIQPTSYFYNHFNLTFIPAKISLIILMSREKF